MGVVVVRPCESGLRIVRGARVAVVNNRRGRIGPAGSTTLEIPLYFGGRLDPTEELFAWDLRKPFTLVLAESSAAAGVVPTGAVKITITRDGAAFGEVRWAAGASSGVVDLPTTWPAGLYRFQPPTAADLTFASPRITLIGSRT